MGSAAEGLAVRDVERPSANEIREVLALARTASDTDGADPLSEHVLLRLRQEDAAPVRHLMLRQPDGVLAGYAQLEDAGAAEGSAAELVVHPMHRRRGLGRALVDAVVRAGTSPLHAWAHGDHPSAAALALDLGFQRVRELWQMRRSLADPLPEAQLPPGVSLRAFRPGEDERAWLEVNRRAFADHPEQGRWTDADLRVRMAESWFDPAGFLLAVREDGGQLVGFHWTKVHGAEPASANGDQPGSGGGSALLGEVYVLGVDPSAHGLGLGRALTVAGLSHLRDRGLTQAMLYVDESNTAAVSLYRRLGFARWSTDVRYRRA